MSAHYSTREPSGLPGCAAAVLLVAATACAASCAIRWIAAKVVAG